MKLVIFRIARIVVACYAGLCLFVWVTQRSFIYHPTKARQSPFPSFELDVEGTKVKVATRPLDCPRAVIYFGGNAEDVAYALPELQDAFPDHALYLMHYRGYSGSEGRPSEAALHQDAKALFDRVHAEHADVVVVGRSLGSGLAVRLAATEPVRHLVLVTPFDSLLNVAKRVFPLLPFSLLLVDKYESWRWAPQVQVPTLIIAAANDEIVPANSTQALYKAFQPGIASMRVIENANHNSVSLYAEYVAALKAGE